MRALNRHVPPLVILGIALLAGWLHFAGYAASKERTAITILDVVEK